MLHKLDYNSPVILSYFFISAIVLALGYATGGQIMSAYFTVFRTSFDDPLQYLRLITHICGHASFNHFIGNFLMILILGPMLEEKYGSPFMLQAMLVTAAVTGLFSIMLFPQVALAGASSIVFMLILLASIVNFRSGRIPMTFLLVLVLYLGQELYDTLFTQGNTSHFAHIVGGLCGAVLGFFKAR